MSIQFTGNKTALRRNIYLPSSHSSFTICGFAKLLTAAPGRTATIAYTQSTLGNTAKTAMLESAAGTGLCAGDSYNSRFSSNVATVTAGGASGANWFFFALVGTALGANGLRIYHKPVGSGTLGYSAVSNDADPSGTTGFAAIQFGDLPYGTSGWFDGLLAHLKIYNRTLSDSELTVEAGQGAPVSTSNLISYHSFSAATIGDALIPDQGSGGWDYFTSAPSISADAPSFSSTPTLVGEDTLPIAEAAITVAPAITTALLPSGGVGVAYSQTVAATGTAPITWAVTSGALPAGLSIDGATGLISGTPTTAGLASFTVTATNSAGSSAQALSIAISATAIAPAISTTTLASGTLGQPYAQTVAATGTAPIVWAVQAGTLPAGLSLNASTGAIRGTPAASGVHAFTLSATNGAGTASQSFTVQISAPMPPEDDDGWTRLPRDVEVWIRVPRA